MIVFFQYYSFLSFTHELGKRLIEVANEEPVEEQQQTLIIMEIHYSISESYYLTGE